jgi:hypothetical protein
VSGTWSGGFSGNASCTTTSNGTCTVKTGNLNKSKSSVTFTVANVTANGGSYAPASNRDPEGDSNGTTITIIR